MNIADLKNISKERVRSFFITHWGSPQMVISSGVYNCDQLNGFAVLDEQNQIIGLVTYILKEKECEIISLDSLIENIGIGSSLLKVLEEFCKEREINRIQLITTNDNLHALGFYQKRGYLLEKLFPNAVQKARKLKPAIPFIADNGIPVRDELLLVKEIN